MWKRFINSILHASAKKKIASLVIIALVIVGVSVAGVKLSNHSPDAQNTAKVEQTQKDDTKGKTTDSNQDSDQDLSQIEQDSSDSDTGISSDNTATDVSKSGTNTTSNKKSNSRKWWQKVADAITGNNKNNGNSNSNGSNNSNGGNTNNGNGSSGDNKTVQYNVTFATGDGTPISSRKVDAGTKISTLPTAYRDGYIFTSWFYDEARTKAAAQSDGIDHDLTLYAEYAQQEPMEAIEQETFASATNVQGSSFTLDVVTEDKSLDANAVKDAIEAKNLTDPYQKDIIEVTGSNGNFVVSGLNPITDDGAKSEVQKGFAAGSTYRIELTDSRLNFKDKEDSVREYNFTTDKEEVLNVTLKQDITYLPAKNLQNITNDGKSVKSLSIALYQADSSGKLQPTELTEGTFDYKKADLKVGDIVSVYTGTRPDLRTLSTPDKKNGDVAYLEITEKDGDHYTYKNADPEDVIFEPDILPIPADADQDNKAGSVTVDNDYLDYSSDVYSNVELDSQTTVDIGDFVLFYTGEFGKTSGADKAALKGYGKITSVKENKDHTTTIGYQVVTWDEVQQAMDIYANDQMSGEDMIAGVDTKQLEKAIEEQATSSGFAEEAAQYLGSLALATNNFTKLSENMNLEDYKVTLEDGTPITPEELQLMASGISASCEMEKGYPKASISTKPSKLTNIEGTAARNKGLSIKLEVKSNITIGKAGSDNQIKITVTGVFEQEVGLDMGVSSKAVWKVWGIFPYIAEYRVTANVDVLNYTGIDVNAVMTTSQKDEEHSYDTALDIADQIKELISSADDKNGEDVDKEESSNKLVQRYSEMLKEESDWVRLIEQNIFKQEWKLPPALPIIAVSTEANFVVEMNACISIGFDFQYQTGKRYTYTVDVFAARVSNDTVSLLEETYEFSFYAMGKLGVRAGVEFEFKVGLFSTDLDSVGFNAEAGAYTKMWGYFYYELHYAESSGRSQSYNGALLIDVGAYLDLGLKAQAFNDRYKAEYKIFDKEWSLYTVGNQDNILDFATAQEDMPYIKLKQHIRSATIPDSVFSLDYLDLKDGKEKQAIYNDYYDASKKESSTNRKNFEITMTNDKFTYDPQTNTITVNPAAGDKKLEGEMIITWVRYPLAFTSRPIQRRITLYWDNVRDGYVIVPYTNGGSYLNIINAKYEAKVAQPEDPVKPGYDFAGWYSDEELTVPYTFPEKMPAEDINIYAKWTESTDTPYRVEHYLEDLRSGEYELTDSEDLTGTTNSYVTPETKTYTGYNAPAKQEVKIEADGSTVLRYYYELQTHTVTFAPGVVGGEDISYDLKYGGNITAPEMAVKGYSFNGWDKTVSKTMGTEDVTYTAQWTKKADTPYRVEYYVQALDGTYRLQDVEEYTGYTESQIAAGALRNRTLSDGTVAEQKYAVENGIAFEQMTSKGVVCDSATIDADGKSVFKIYYKRLKHNVTFDWGYEDKTVSQEAAYEENVSVLNEVSRPGYTFEGWYDNNDFTGEKLDSVTVADRDITLYAKWTANTDTAYAVEHYLADLNGNYVLTDREELKGTTDTEVTPAVKTYTGFASPKKQTASIQGDGSTVVRYEYARKSYTITFDVNGGTMNDASSVTALYGAPITLPTPTRDGYGFNGWYSGDAKFTDALMPAKNVSLTAKWTAGQYSYTVNHYIQNLDDTSAYTLVETVSDAADMDSSITPERKSYTGFTAPEKTTTIVIGTDDAKNVVNYYYTRNKYMLSWDLAGGEAENAYTFGNVYYEAPITAPAPVKKGYSFHWDKTPESNMPDHNLSYTAKWTANQYNVFFERNGGTAEDGSDVSAKTVTYAAAYGELPTLTKTGYTFDGWYTDAKEGEFVTDQTKVLTDQDHTLYAHFTPITYQIRYENMEGVENAQDNPTEFTIETNTITLHDPQNKTGYTFDGWYTDASFEHRVTGAMTLNSLNDWTFYAKWNANPYTITFDSCLGKEVPVETLLMTYDQSANLTLLSELKGFNKPGYTFGGWTTTEGGAAVYKDGQNVINLAAGGNVTLYAVWNVNVYNISYDLGTGGISHANPASYTIEDGDVKLAAPQAKAGYQFLGWYDGDTRVSEIVKGTQQNYSLTAKWAHAGVFNLSYVSEADTTLKDGSQGTKVTYKVTRTLPEGTVATANPQTVYYRTVNGTAYGSTVEIEIAGDKYHFKHAGGEDVYLTFGQNDMEKTFTIEEWDAYAGDDMAATMYSQNTSRYYDVELYKVIDTVGTCSGTLGDTTSVRRVLAPLSGYGIYGVQQIFNNQWFSYTWNTGNPKITQKRYNNRYYFKTFMQVLSESGIDADKRAYIQKTASNAGFYMTVDMQEDDDGYFWVRLHGGGGYICEYVIDTKGKDWQTEIAFPFHGGNWQKKAEFKWDKGGYNTDSRIVWGSPAYAKIGVNDSVQFEAAAEGAGKNSWYLGTTRLYYKAIDQRAPQQVGIANLAFGHYKKGDQISVTVIYDEVIKSAENVTFSTSAVDALPISNVTYVDGAGTNALTFTATVTADDFEVTPDVNNAIKDKKPVAGTVKDVFGN